MQDGRYVVCDMKGKSIGAMDPKAKVLGDYVFSSWKTSEEAFSAAERISQREDAPKGPYRVGFFFDTVVFVPRQKWYG